MRFDSILAALSSAAAILRRVAFALPAAILLLPCAILMDDSGARAQKAQAPNSTILIESLQPESMPAGLVRSYGLTRDDFRRITETIPTIRDAVPVRVVRREVRRGERTSAVRVVGTSPAFTRTSSIPALETGRFLSERDSTRINTVAVIGAGVARDLFRDEKPIGKIFRMGATYLYVVGVLQPSQSRPARAGEPGPDHRVFIPYSTMRSRLGDLEVVTRTGTREARRYELSRIEVTTQSAGATRQTADLIRNLLRKYHEETEYSIRIKRGI